MVVRVVVDVVAKAAGAAETEKAAADVVVVKEKAVGLGLAVVGWVVVVREEAEKAVVDWAAVVMVREEVAKEAEKVAVGVGERVAAEG